MQSSIEDLDKLSLYSGEDIVVHAYRMNYNFTNIDIHAGLFMMDFRNLDRNSTCSLAEDVLDKTCGLTMLWEDIEEDERKKKLAAEWFMQHKGELLPMIKRCLK